VEWHTGGGGPPVGYSTGTAQPPQEMDGFLSTNCVAGSGDLHVTWNGSPLETTRKQPKPETMANVIQLTINLRSRRRVITKTMVWSSHCKYPLLGQQ